MYSQWIKNASKSWKHTCTETKNTIIIYPGLSLKFEVEWWTNINSQCTYNLECSIVVCFISQVKDDEHFRLIALQFNWRGEKGKPMSSCFLGTSPEFEIAAYTVCFLSGKHGRNMDVQLGEYEVEISCLPLGRDCIGTAYIAAARM